jgi:hypothetical protein
MLKQVYSLDDRKTNQKDNKHFGDVAAEKPLYNTLATRVI